VKPRVQELMLLVSFGVLGGCAGTTYRFVQTDQSFQIAPRDELTQVLVDEQEVVQAPPFKLVGVLEVEGKEMEHLAVFVKRVAQAGAKVGCDVVVQRDAFEGGTRVRRLDGAGRDWRRNDRAIWQFLCGVNGATAAEQLTSMRLATATAVKMRADELGSFEPCAPYTPLGSRVRKTRVCADDPGKHSEADARSSAR
jgi:hypothetical protein